MTMKYQTVPAGISMKYLWRHSLVGGGMTMPENRVIRLAAARERRNGCRVTNRRSWKHRFRRGRGEMSPRTDPIRPRKRSAPTRNFSCICFGLMDETDQRGIAAGERQRNGSVDPEGRGSTASSWTLAKWFIGDPFISRIKQ